MLEEWLPGIERRTGGDHVLVDSAIDHLVAARFESDLDRLRYLGYRGMTIDNPQIRWSYVTTHGIRLEGERALHLRDLAMRFPILPRPSDL